MTPISRRDEARGSGARRDEARDGDALRAHRPQRPRPARTRHRGLHLRRSARWPDSTACRRWRETVSAKCQPAGRKASRRLAFAGTFLFSTSNPGRTSPVKRGLVRAGESARDRAAAAAAEHSCARRREGGRRDAEDGARAIGSCIARTSRARPATRISIRSGSRWKITTSISRWRDNGARRSRSRRTK